MVRRIALSGIVVLFDPGSVIQSAASILICVASITVYSVYAPLRSLEDNTLQWTTQIQLFLVLLSTLMMKADASEDSEDDGNYLGILLIIITSPGYVFMIWSLISEWISFGKDVANELGVDEGDNTIRSVRIVG